MVLEAGKEYALKLIYTPEDTDNYKIVSGIPFTVNVKAQKPSEDKKETVITPGQDDSKTNTQKQQEEKKEEKIESPAPNEPAVDPKEMPEVKVDKTKIKSITVGSLVTKIDENLFAEYPNLETVVIGKNVKKFGPRIFAKNKKLRTVIFESSKLKAKYFHKKTFKGMNKKVVIKVTKSKVKTYRKLFRKKGLAKKIKVKKK